MKIAFVHCWIMPWWALDVFKDLINKEEYEEAHIFTLVSDRKRLDVWERKIDIITSIPRWINNIFVFFKKKNVPILSKIFDYRNLIVFYPLLMKILSKKIKKFEAEKIVISSFAIAKNIDYTDGIYTKLYLHSPMQYIWDHHSEYSAKLKWLVLWIFNKMVPRLRNRDKKYTHFDEVYVNSEYTEKLTKEIYWIRSKISYPQISEEFRDGDVTENPMDYYVFVWRTVKFVKELDKIVQLFNETEEPLLIIWDGPDEKELKLMSKWNIIYLWWMKNVKERIDIIRKAKWLINITKESFGMWTAEALMLWVPVFGYNQWATPELVDKDSWLLVEDKDIKTLKKWFYEFQDMEFNRELISKKIRRKLV